METRDYFLRALELTQKKLDDFLFKCAYRLSSIYFSRVSKLGFKETVLFMMNMAKGTLQLELNNFLKVQLKKITSASKQAYSIARQKIKSELFIDLNDTVVKGFYDECKDWKTWNDYRLLAIDGTVLEIPNNKVLQQEFGTAKNQNGEVARARAVCMYDIQNHLIIKSRIDRFDIGERNLAKILIEQVITDGNKNDLILFDRGYPAADLIAMLTDKNIAYLMRAQKNFRKEIKKAKEADQIVKIKHDKNNYNVRVLRFILNSGEEEILITNLFDANFTTKDFANLYSLRWGIEVKYNDLKHKMQIESFTGASKISIEQDFYATIYLSNMAEFARIRNEEKIKERTNGKGLKYEYKPNLNIIIGTLKDNLILMLLEKNKNTRNKMYAEIMDEIARSSVPKRPGRSNPRNKFLNRTNHALNKKRCL